MDTPTPDFKFIPSTHTHIHTHTHTLILFEDREPTGLKVDIARLWLVHKYYNITDISLIGIFFFLKKHNNKKQKQITLLILLYIPLCSQCQLTLLDIYKEAD